MAPEQVVQVFGLRDSRATRKAQRFFKERRVSISFVDLARRPIAPTELRRFADRYGSSALVDTEARAYREAGLAWQRVDESEWLARLLAQPALIRLPLVRAGSRLAVGDDEAAWRAIVA